jgi:hypothetical protein
MDFALQDFETTLVEFTDPILLMVSTCSKPPRKCESRRIIIPRENGNHDDLMANNFFR